MPVEREEMFRLHSVDPDGHRHVLHSLESHMTAHLGARSERALEIHTEPGVELLDIRERAPHARSWSVEGDLLFNPIGRCCSVGHGSSHLEFEGSLSGW